MIQYSGGTLINRTFTPVTRLDLVQNITQALSDAGWTTISGTAGTSADVTMETAATAAGAKVRFRFFDPGSGNCMQVTLKHSSGSPTSTVIHYCLPGSVQWRVIANKFSFWAFQSSSALSNAARSNVMGSVLWTPSWVTIAAGDGVGWMEGAGISDTDATLKQTFRVSLRPGNSVPCTWAGLYISTMTNGSVGAPIGHLSLCVFQGGLATQDTSYRWEDLTYLVYEPFMAWATAGSDANESRIKGQVYDAIIVSGTYTSEATIAYDGHNWMAITDTTISLQSQTATLFVAVP